MRPIFLYAVGLSLALGAGTARAAADAPSSAIIEIAPAQDRGPRVHDLGFLPPPGSDDPAQTRSSVFVVSSAEAVPELSTWAMMLLCLSGLGLATFKRGRKDRLSPGIE